MIFNITNFFHTEHIFKYVCHFQMQMNKSGYCDIVHVHNLLTSVLSKSHLFQSEFSGYIFFTLQEHVLLTQ